MTQTQCQRLLDAFEAKGELYVYEIIAPRPSGLGIAQYNARIKELREQGHQIINAQPGHFVYKTDTAERKPDMDMTQPGSGYERFKQMGQFLKGQSTRPVNPYESMPVDELEALKAKAEAWLEGNFDHPKYPEALTRFENICDALIKLSLTGE
jgi:hypothetical protein